MLSLINIIVGIALVAVAVSFFIIYRFTERSDGRSARSSVWQYGSGAYHSTKPHPPVSRSATSVPTGSSDPSHWPTSNASRNRIESH